MASTSVPKNRRGSAAIPQSQAVADLAYREINRSAVQS
jgi:hypothetical protein